MSKIKDLKGQKIGSWTVLERSEKQTKDRIYYWLCRCDCGNEKEVRGQNLRNGNSLRCHVTCPVFLEERRREIFAKKTIKAANGCWIWTGLKSRNGYGCIGDGIYAHRFAYEMYKGKIPDGLCILHICDNQSCVNPKHLWIGNRDENNKDRMKKGRSAKGENNGKSKLNKNVVIKIRNIYKEGKMTKADLARKFGVTHSTISQVVNYETWKDF